MKYFAEINYVNEGISLLTCLAQPISIKEQIEKESRKYTDNIDALFKARKPLMALYGKIEKAARKEFKGDMEELLYYFSLLSTGSKKDSFGKILLLWDDFYHLETPSFEEYSRTLYEMDQLAYYSKYSEFVSFIGNALCNTEDAPKCTCLEDALRVVLEAKLSDNNKQLLMEGLINREKHLEKCLLLVEKAINLLGKFQEELKVHYKWFTDYWTDKFQGRMPWEYFTSQSQTLSALNDNPFGVLISFEFFKPFIKGFSVSMDKETGEFDSPFASPIGVMFCHECPLVFADSSESTNYSTEFWLNTIKQMSDKNRFEILSYIKDRPSFGNELASLLKLTTATVSHHTSQLNSAELINFSQEGARIYYSSNKDTIRNCIQNIKDELSL